MTEKFVLSCGDKLSNEVLKLCANGGVYLHGKLVTKEDYERMKRLLALVDTKILPLI